METASVELDLGFPLMRLFSLTSPSVSVNGVVHALTWGKHPMQLAPGPYLFEAWHPLGFTAKARMAQLRIELEAGRSYGIKYAPLPRLLGGGSLYVTGTPTLPRATAVR